MLIKQQMIPQSLAGIVWDALGDALETCQALLTLIFWTLKMQGSLTVHWTLLCLFGIPGFLHQPLRDAQGPPCPSASLQLLSDFISGAVPASLFCHGLTQSSINKIIMPGCIRLFLFCCDPTLNLGRRRRQQTPLPQKRADHQAESLFLTLLMEEQSLPKIFWNKWNNNIAIMVALSAMTIAWIDL